MKVSRLRFPVVMLMIILCMGSLTDTVLYAGDLVLTGNDFMVIENTTYTQTGNIYVKDNAKLTIRNATLILPVSFHEEFIMSIEGGTLEVINSTIKTSTGDGVFTERLVLINFFGKSNLIFNNSNLSSGAVYIQFMGGFQGNASISNSKLLNLTWTIGSSGPATISVFNTMFNWMTLWFEDNFEGEVSNLKPSTNTNWSYSKNGYNINIQESTWDSVTVVGGGPCNVTIYNSELFGLSANAALSTLHLKTVNSVIENPTLHALRGVSATLTGLKTGFFADWKLSEHATGGQLPNITLENTEIRSGWSLSAFDGTNLIIDDSNMRRLRMSANPGSIKTSNSTIDELMFFLTVNSTTYFQNTIIRNVTVYVPPNASTIAGDITFTSDAKLTNWDTPSTIKRTYPVAVMGDFGNNPPPASLSLYNKAGTLVWSGQTDAQGKANIDIEFTDENHNDAWNLEITFLGKKQSKAITLLTSTPIQVYPTYEIIASAGSNGAISPSGRVTVNEGAAQTFQIQPNKFDVDRVQGNGIYPDGSHRVSDVLVDGVSVSAVTSYTFNNVQADHTISANFSTATPSSTEVIYDDFGGSGIDTSKWTVNDQNNVFSLSGGYLNVNAAGNASYYDIRLKQPFTGDLDIVLPYKDFHSTGQQAGGRINIFLNGPNGNWGQVVIGGYTGNLSIGANASINGTISGNSASIASPSGWLRMIRTGSTLKTYYREDDKWILLKSFANFVGSAEWDIQVYSGNSGTFHVSSDGVYSPNDCVSSNVVLSPYADAFASTSALGAVTVTPSSSSCSWTTASNSSWIAVTSGSSGTGNYPRS